MLNRSDIYGQLQENLWSECAKTSTLLNNVLYKKEIHYDKKSPPQSPYQVFYVKLPKYFLGLRVFVDIGILKTSYLRLQSKLLNKGTMEIFVGYSTRNVYNVYIMFNLTTQSIRISPDISWMNVNYGKWKSHVKKGHDPTFNKEKFINDDDDH